VPIVIRGSYFFVTPYQKCYEIASNFSNYIEIGERGITPYYLEAKIDNDEFKISGILFDATGEVLCTLENNFISTSRGCTKEMTKFGYRIKNKQGTRIFEIRAEDNVCHLEGTIFSSSGETVAQSKDGVFVILKGPAIIGKSNGSIGIKIE
jgi:hypothetical protein